MVRPWSQVVGIVPCGCGTQRLALRSRICIICCCRFALFFCTLSFFVVFHREGHTRYVVSTCFSPFGNIVASGSYDRTIRLWNAKTGQETNVLTGHTGSVTSVCFSPDGHTVASGSWDCTVRLWHTKTGDEIKKFQGHTDQVASVCFSLLGNMLASGSCDKTVRLWDTKTGEELNKMSEHTAEVASVCFSADGQVLASSSFDKTVRLWNTTHKLGDGVKILEGGTTIYALCFSPEG